MKFVKSALNKHYGIFIMLVCCSAVITLFPAEGMRRITVAIEKYEMSILIEATLFLSIMFLIQSALNYSLGILEMYIMEKQSIKIENKIIKKIIKAKKMELSRVDDGKLIINITNNVRSYIWNFMCMVKNGIKGGVILVATVVYIFILNWKLASVFMCYQTIIILINKVLGKNINKFAKKVVQKKQLNTSIILDYLKNFSLIKTMRGYGVFDRFEDNERDYVGDKIRLDKNKSALTEFVMMASQIGQIIVIMGIGGYLIRIGQCSVAVIVAFFSCQFQIMRVSGALTMAFINKKVSYENFNAFKGIFDIEESDRYQIVSNKGFEKLNYNNISFGFGEKKIMEASNLVIKSGDRIKISGENGKGKSTLLNLIMGLYDFDEGEVRYNDEVFNNKELKNIFTYIPQSPMLFQGTIKDNITFGQYDEPRYERIVEGLNLCELIGKFEEEHSFDGFSDGEKQRICIGRALFNAHENSIIICDEIFSCLDKDNISRVVELLQVDYLSNSIVMISHQDIPIQFCKEIQIQENQIIENVLHENLRRG